MIMPLQAIISYLDTRIFFSQSARRRNPMIGTNGHPNEMATEL